MANGVLGIIAPHPPIMVDAVGGRDAAMTRRSADAMAEAADALARFDPDTLVVMSPHSPGVRDAFVIDTAERYQGDLGRFGAPGTTVEYTGDTAFATSLIASLEGAGISTIDRRTVPRLGSGLLDHGVVVPMSFLDAAGRRPIVNLSPSGLDMSAHRSVGRMVTRVAATLDRRIAFVASGDLSHRLSPDAPAGFAPGAERFDELVVELVVNGDLDGLASIDETLADLAGECGLRSFVTLSGALDDVRTRVLAYEAPWGVGYLTALAADSQTFAALDLETPARGSKGGRAGGAEHEIVSLARAAIDAHVRRGEHIDPPRLTDTSLPERAGAFVTLYLDGALRGCIGTIVPTTGSLAAEVVRNAIQAATADPRFARLDPEELDRLEIKVDVLNPPEQCTEADLDPACHGVIVVCGTRQGLLLPDLEGVDTPERQLEIARRKAGIGSHEPVECHRFTVDRYV